MRNYNILLVDETLSVPTSDRDAIEQTLWNAYREWTGHFISNREIGIRLNIVPGLEERVLASACSASMVAVGSYQNRPVFVPGAAYKLAFGHDANGGRADIIINLNAARLNEFRLRDDDVLDGSKFDLHSVFFHELSHAFFMCDAGGPHPWFTGDRLSPWDCKVKHGPEGAFFKGVNAMRVHGGPVPLDDAWHLDQEIAAKFNSPLAKHIPRGQRLEISELEVAMAADLGLPTAHADFIFAGRYSGTIDTGDGLDTVLINESWLSAVIVGAGSAWQLSDAAQTYSITFLNTERLKFLDGTVALDVDGYAGLVYRLYTLFQREPDRPGLSFWLNRLEGGMAPRDLAHEFLVSDEYKLHFRPELSNEDYIQALYTRLRKTSPTHEEVNSSLSELSGTSREEMLLDFANHPDTKLSVAEAVSHGILLDSAYF
jgi:hypothetical protein